MKGFWASLIIFIFIIVIVAANHVYVCSVLDKMRELTEALLTDQANSSDEISSELKKYWVTHSKFIALSLCFNDIDRISEELVRLECAVLYQNNYAAHQSAKLLLDAIDDAYRHETVSPFCIL